MIDCKFKKQIKVCLPFWLGLLLKNIFIFISVFFVRPIYYDVTLIIIFKRRHTCYIINRACFFFIHFLNLLYNYKSKHTMQYDDAARDAEEGKRKNNQPYSSNTERNCPEPSLSLTGIVRAPSVTDRNTFLLHICETPSSHYSLRISCVYHCIPSLHTVHIHNERSNHTTIERRG